MESLFSVLAKLMGIRYLFAAIFYLNQLALAVPAMFLESEAMGSRWVYLCTGVVHVALLAGIGIALTFRTNWVVRVLGVRPSTLGLDRILRTGILRIGLVLIGVYELTWSVPTVGADLIRIFLGDFTFEWWGYEQGEFLQAILTGGIGVVLIRKADAILRMIGGDPVEADTPAPTGA